MTIWNRFHLNQAPELTKAGDVEMIGQEKGRSTEMAAAGLKEVTVLLGIEVENEKEKMKALVEVEEGMKVLEESKGKTARDVAEELTVQEEEEKKVHEDEIVTVTQGSPEVEVHLVGSITQIKHWCREILVQGKFFFLLFV